MLAGLADAAGLFELLARRPARLAGGSTRRLFLLVCLIASTVTIVLSLNTTAVLLTPVAVALALAVDVDARPFAFATVWLANAASFLLPVSNLLAAERPGFLGELSYAGRMLPPELVAIAVVVCILLLRFRTPLRHRQPLTRTVRRRGPAAGGRGRRLLPRCRPPRRCSASHRGKPPSPQPRLSQRSSPSVDATPCG